VGAVWLARQMARPLAQLTQSAERMACGQATEMAPLNRVDDLGTLSRAVNQAGLNLRSLLDERDAIISDALNHASIIDGVRLCKAQRFRYANCDMADLEKQLQAAEASGCRTRLITTDGEFANHITSPKTHVEKTYVAKVNGNLNLEQLEQFRAGIPLHGRRTAPAQIKLLRPGANPWYEITLTEGRQNQIRIMFKNFGRLVEKLRRVRIGKLKLDVPVGEFRHLTDQEVSRLQKTK